MGKFIFKLLKNSTLKNHFIYQITLVYIYIYIYLTKGKIVVCPVTVRRKEIQEWGQEYWWVSRSLMTSRKIALVLWVRTWKKTIANDRAGIEHLFCWNVIERILIGQTYPVACINTNTEAVFTKIEMNEEWHVEFIQKYCPENSIHLFKRVFH